MNNIEIEIEIEAMASGVLWVREKRAAGFYRYCVFPGEDASSRPPEVQDAVGRLHTPEVIAAYQGSLPPAEPISPPAPSYGAAWLELINSALYRRVLEALPTHNAVAVFTGAFLKSVDEVFTHQHWAGALSASIDRLATAINATDAPLTTEEMAWVEDWSDRNNLGLAINWSA